MGGSRLSFSAVCLSLRQIIVQIWAHLQSESTHCSSRDAQPESGPTVANCSVKFEQFLFWFSSQNVLHGTKTHCLFVWLIGPHKQRFIFVCAYLSLHYTACKTPVQCFRGCWNDNVCGWVLFHPSTFLTMWILNMATAPHSCHYTAGPAWIQPGRLSFMLKYLIPGFHASGRVVPFWRLRWCLLSFSPCGNKK